MDEYIKRFMETLDEDERGKDIEVQVFIEGEHTTTTGATAVIHFN